MKKQIIISAVFAAFSLVSCKKDTDSTPAASRSQLLVGTWDGSFTALDSNANKILDANERVPVTDSASVTLKADGTGSLSTALGKADLTWKLYDSEKQLIYAIPGLGADTSYIHTLNTKELILEDRAAVYSWKGAVKR